MSPIVLAAAALAIASWALLLGPMAVSNASRGGPVVSVAALSAVTLLPIAPRLLDPEAFLSLIQIGEREINGAARASLQASTIAFTAIAVTAVVALLVNRRPPIPPPVWFAIAFASAISLSSIVAGTFDPVQLLFPGLILASASCWATPRETIIRAASAVFRIILLGSALVAIFDPARSYSDLTLANGGRFLGIPQLSGLTSNPNILGGIAAVALVLEFTRPLALKRLPWMLMAATVLLWCQSRNAWLMVIVALSIRALRRNTRERAFGIVAIAGVAFVAVLGSGGSSLFGLTGRNRVWTVSARLFESSPLIGSGSGSVREAAEQAGIFWAGTAHNQVMQSLAEGGLVSGLIVVGFFVAAFRTSAASWRRGDWLPMALTAAVLVKGAFDVVLTASPEFLLLISVFTAAATGDTIDRTAGAPRRGRTRAAPDPAAVSLGSASDAADHWKTDSPSVMP